MGALNEAKMRQLRQRAEAMLTTQSATIPDLPSPETVRALIQDLAVYQIELELQNEELQRTQQETERIRDSYARLYHEAPVGYLTLSPAGIILQHNDTFARLTGLTNDQLQGMPLADLLLAEDRTVFLGRFRSFFRNPEGRSIEVRMDRRGGNPCWVRLTARNISILPTTSAGKNTTGGILVVMDDISQRKEAEELERNRAELQAIYENAPVMMGLLNEDSTIIYANLALAEFFGTTPDQLADKKICKVIGCVYALDDPPGCSHHATCNLLQQTIRDTFSTGIPQRHVEYRIVLTTDGAPREAILRGDTALIPIGDRSQLLLCLEDMTERTRMEEALLAAKDQAEAANRAKATFLANMSHEIRTPLNAILGFAQLLARTPELSARQRDNLNTIQRSGEHLLTLFNDILDMARIEAGRMTIQAAPFDLQRLITGIEELFRQPARDRGLALMVEMWAIPRWVAGDKIRLRQILLNLVGNAIKFTSAGKVTLRLQDHAARDQIRFSILDTGIGITPDKLLQLFKPFAQTATSGQPQGGTGLGLALSHQLVQLMGGELTVDSTPGQGSCFAFTLPLPMADVGSVEPTSVRYEGPSPPWVQSVQSPAKDQPRLSSVEVAIRLAAGPTEWRTELKNAVDMGDFDQITKLLESVRADDALYETLAYWAYRYDLEAFSRALSGG